MPWDDDTQDELEGALEGAVAAARALAVPVALGKVAQIARGFGDVSNQLLNGPDAGNRIVGALLRGVAVVVEDEVSAYAAEYVADATVEHVTAGIAQRQDARQRSQEARDARRAEQDVRAARAERAREAKGRIVDVEFTVNDEGPRKARDQRNGRPQAAQTPDPRRSPKAPPRKGPVLLLGPPKPKKRR